MVSLSTKLVNFSEAFHSIPIKCVISCDNLIKNISLARKSWLSQEAERKQQHFMEQHQLTWQFASRVSHLLGWEVGCKSLLYGQLVPRWGHVDPVGGLLVNKIHLMQLVQHRLDGMTLKPHCQIVDGQPECGWLSRVRSLEFKHLYHLETFKRMTMLLQYHKFTSHQFL